MYTRRVKLTMMDCDGRETDDNLLIAKSELLSADTYIYHN